MLTFLSILKDLAIAIASKKLAKLLFKSGGVRMYLTRKSLRQDCDKKIHLVKRDLKKLPKKKKNKGIRFALKEELEHLLFLKEFGYDWPKNKRDAFLNIYKKLRGSMTISMAKRLHTNIKICDGIIRVKISNWTRFDIGCHFSMSLLMFILFPVLFLFSFHVTRNADIGQPLFWILSGTAFSMAIHNLIQGIQKPFLIKRMKEEFDGMQIK